MKIKAMLVGIGAALALTAGLGGLAGTAAADQKPSVTSAPAPAKERPTSAPVPAEDRPTAAPVPADERPSVRKAGPQEPVVVRPSYTG
ncbi:hypothetical protein [Streptosporangium sp. NPDC020145]|uniref:Uncharacterized protein n=1 Tax=Streptosporangium jomthongense TaxID=1193683 RepID=A0ABV8ES90_9ACTN